MPPPLPPDQLISAMRNLPVEVHWAAALGLILGLVLWLVGRSVIKPILASVGFVGVGLLGYMLVPQTGVNTLLNIPSPYVGLGIGGLLGFALAVALYRFAMATATALVLGPIAALGAAGYLQIAPVSAPEQAPQSAPLSGQALYMPGVPRVSDAPARERFVPAAQVDTTAPPAPEAADAQTNPDEQAQQQVRAGQVAQHVRRFAGALLDELLGAWVAQPIRHRILITISGIIGASLGLLIGLLMPERAAGGVTAMLGSAIWLPNFVWLSLTLNIAWARYLHQGPVVWLSVWLVLGLLGASVQWITMHRAKSKPDSEGD